ncbi:LacI family DNA-binding transcriptional regulator [Paracoccus sp. PAR01]|jgi:LacI family transcriptional regulator|uniref:LacI family DNA-binding transcriptional regulator n=1 Tax=Paracoccus TaxID=265 RepID=UPI001787680F|nr:LacI family DNA-binding transcriptional regulator [Paracoccus sp. PAR01]MBD9529093.1 LacI family DNA-binding transcriptional regulator [Paracoccus sp. PAR01]
MQGKITLQDVARVAGVSRATVSLVVRKSPLVADATRVRVEKVMAELDYVRDLGAARLRDKSSRTIGVVVPNLVNSFFTEFLSGVEQVMGEGERVVLLANSQDDPARQDAILHRFRGHGVDGVILCPTQDTDPGLLGRLRQWDLPVVQSLREVGDGVTDFAGGDYIDGVTLAMRHLVSFGHRRIAFLSVSAQTSAREQRLRGWAQSLIETGAENSGIVETALTWEAAAQSAARVLELPDRPTAVLCFNDVLAAGFMAGLRQVGKVPGRDIAVVGLDDLPMAELLYPTLTSVAMMPERIGQMAARLLVRRMADGKAAIQRCIVSGQLMIRESSGKEIN